MHMKKGHWIIPLLLGLGTFLVTWFANQRTIAFVNLETVFSGFEMRKELQKDFDQAMKQKQVILDSAKMNLASLKVKWEANRDDQVLYEQLMNAWQRNETQSEELEESMAQMTKTFDDQIQQRLQLYLKEFGENKHLDLLMGVMNNGTVLYNSEGIDYTQQAIEYVNEKYLDK
jgi:Skp family chaperone for outer membrane proteins